VRKSVSLAFIQLGFLAACGGGGGPTTVTPPPPPPPTQNIATPGPPNVETLTVDTGPAGGPAGGTVNTSFVSVTVCPPGSTTIPPCQTIDHIEVDTGSIGLRIISSALTVTLPALTDASGNQIAECIQFADGASWGAVRTADIVLPVSTEKAAGVHIEVIGDAAAGAPASGSPPTGCTLPTSEQTVGTFGAKGILGVGPFINDCNSGGTCPSGVQSANYYSCPTPTTCAAITATLAEQLQNPVALFTATGDTNGVIIELPTVGAGGAATATGSLVFGIGTQSNNGLGSATVLPADLLSGVVSAKLNTVTYMNAYLDSGSNGSFFTDSALSGSLCSGNAGFYCPMATTNEAATLTGTNSVMLAANFSVANANTLFTTANTAFSNLGGPNADTSALDLGMPFFFGHNVFTAIELHNTPGGMGPYFAYCSPTSGCL
jgi:hypothetical protein